MSLSKPTSASAADYLTRINLLFDAVNLLGHAIYLCIPSFVTAGVTRYFGGGPSSTAETDVQCVMTSAGTITKFRVQCTSAPGVGQTFTFTVRKNAVDTTMTGTISGNATFDTGEITTNPVSFSAGDSISIKCVGSAGSATTGFRGFILPQFA